MCPSVPARRSEYGRCVPRRPDFSQHRADPRFDGYRDRVGRLYRADAEAGVVLVRVEPVAQSVGGHLWWTRWSASRDVLWLWTVIDDRFDDSYVPGDASDEVLTTFDQGRFVHYGEELRVRWLDGEESARVRDAAFES